MIEERKIPMKKQPHCFIRIFALIAVICAAIISYNRPVAVIKSETKEGEKKADAFKELREIRIDKVSDKEEKVTFVLNGYYPPKTSV